MGVGPRDRAEPGPPSVKNPNIFKVKHTVRSAILIRYVQRQRKKGLVSKRRAVPWNAHVGRLGWMGRRGDQPNPNSIGVFISSRVRISRAASCFHSLLTHQPAAARASDGAGRLRSSPRGVDAGAGPRPSACLSVGPCQASPAARVRGAARPSSVWQVRNPTGAPSSPRELRRPQTQPPKPRRGAAPSSPPAEPCPDRTRTARRRFRTSNGIARRNTHRP